MTYSELENAVVHGDTVVYGGKSYKIRSIVTKNLKDLPRSMTDHYETRKNVLVDFAELFDPRSNYLFTALAQEVTPYEYQSHIT